MSELLLLEDSQYTYEQDPITGKYTIFYEDVMLGVVWKEDDDTWSAAPNGNSHAAEGFAHEFYAAQYLRHQGGNHAI